MATANSYGIERRHNLERRQGTSHTTSTHTHTRTLSAVDWIALTLVIVGGLNWGSVGLFNVDLVAQLFGPMSPISRAVYVLVGLSALYTIFTATKMANKHDV